MVRSHQPLSSNNTLMNSMRIAHLCYEYTMWHKELFSLFFSLSLKDNAEFERLCVCACVCVIKVMFATLTEQICYNGSY